MAESVPLESPSMSRRQLLNFLTGAAVAATATAALYPAAKFFVPPAQESEDGSILAKDINGNLIPASQILAEPPGTRALVAGLAGEPTYLTVREDGTLHPWGIVDNCTHLGCTFPWNPNENQFQCPCHGSRYDPEGRVVRGPAPLPLKLVRVAVETDFIRISPWTEIDPRTGQKPWWV
ncbi:cytochrome b6-f complex iron-sulfur subunit 1 [Hydrococcus rivularis NIES-593]|uniref:Cytochrome b6-f complex iron-sulfur subunit n=1 Tax=Hydrococcus rivularis NIES-593 TaxID=1921803 RepID=A0A1U7HDS3_9CYAN|nr:cytochrome b6-f complex iron-sulfur subunit [Hydrococcus rivularis]OKH21733.1 cytochrome b6-f complex iron-sulfur subunit 1 [Hydrococcus rivularis NIES-593]